eukprot:evm.model.NODE_4407_length_63659_cov_22.504595.2
MVNVRALGRAEKLPLLSVPSSYMLRRTAKAVSNKLPQLLLLLFAKKKPRGREGGVGIFHQCGKQGIE